VDVYHYRLSDGIFGENCRIDNGGENIGYAPGVIRE
jgi:hypothetical protein